MSAFPPVPEQLAILTRGTVDVLVAAELAERLAENRPLVVKAGFDPTRPDLHLGHAVVMSKLREFQQLGHTVVFVVGDFTAMVGDPTDRDAARPRLTRDEVVAAAATYAEQAHTVLDRERTIVRYNSEWLERLAPSALVELMAQTTVARMLEREDFAKRFAARRPIYQHELLYPLLQGYDSVALACDVEVGATDQLFNLLVGRHLMPAYGQRPQIVMTLPLLVGTDARVVDGAIVGPKMSKSCGNYVGVREPPLVQLRKLMRLDDGVAARFAELLQAAPLVGPPIEAKERLAHELVARFHGTAAADAALAEHRAVDRGGALPSEIAEHAVDDPWICRALVTAGLAASASDARRLIQDGGVQLDGEPVSDPRLQLERGRRYLVRVGKRYARVTASPPA